MKAISGRCQCGALSYECEVPPPFSLHCCCRQCQRISGTGHASVFGLPSDSVRIVGEPQSYPLRADSGNAVTSTFCATCGSPFFKRSSGFPELTFFHAATLDDPSAFAPQGVAWRKSQLHWDTLDPDLPALG